MSGGHFDYVNQSIGYEMEGAWCDPIINELFYDLFCAHNYGSRYGGLALMLDFWWSGDIDEKSYREAVHKFKQKWFGNPNVHQEVIEKYIDEKVAELKKECGVGVVHEQ